MNSLDSTTRWVALCLAAIVAGCGGPTSQLLPLSGTIRYDDGQPLEEGTVLSFSPVNVASASLTVSATVESEGQFAAGTWLDGRGTREGAPPGRYKVTLNPLDAALPSVPKDYLQAATSPLEVEVASSKDSSAESLEVRRAAGKKKRHPSGK